MATHLQTRESRQTRTLRDLDGAGSIMFPKQRLLDLTVGRGGMAVDVLRLTREGLTLGRVVSGGHEVMLEDPENITLLLPVEGRISVQTRVGEQGFNSGSLLFTQAEKRLTKVVAAKSGVFRAVTVQVPRSRIAALMAGRRDEAKGLQDRDIRAIDTMFARQVRSLLPALADDVFRQPDRLLTPRALAEIVSLMDDLLVDDMSNAGGVMRLYGGIREFQRVAQACDIMQARSDEALSLSALATEVGVTPRCLQMTFQAVHGISPRQYLERVRLDRVRDRILDLEYDGRVTSAALDAGFLHLGRFSRIYHRTYGELPSETLGRRRQMSARTGSIQGR